MILILGGTHEGKKISALMNEMGLTHQLSVATDLGKKTYEDVNTQCIVKQFTEASLYSHIRAEQIDCVIDATHPHALEIKKVAKFACKKAAIKYIRYERPAIVTETSMIQNLNSYKTMEDIISTLRDQQKPDDKYLITGTKHIKAFYEVFPKEKCFFRIMPSVYSLKICEELDVPLRNIIAIKAPFPLQLNLTLFATYQITHFIFKNSGEGSAYESNLEAIENSEVQGLVLSLDSPLEADSVADIEMLRRVLNTTMENGGEYA
ncbi:MAG: precorrin-6A reductase [Clostridia bacterium]|nr:precorrin-6A reductase [Clostridia bacterium]